MPALAKHQIIFSLAIMSVAGLAMRAQAQEASLPGGASILNETHGAWAVTCDIGAPQHFRTCLPAGCLIDVDFDARTVEGLKAGDALKIRVTADGGQAMEFSVSLAGFSIACDRIVALMQ